MSLDQRYHSEKQKWDEIAEKQSTNIEILAPDFDFHVFARNDDEFPGISEFLGDLNGKRVLELGCGAGRMAVLLAKSGAEVTAFDLSPESVRLAKKMAEANHVDIKFVISAGEHLPFLSESFHIVIGKSILHHLVIELGKRDLYRVLREGGKAVFVEPMGMNPILTFVRKYVPYPHKATVGVDRPLSYKDMKAWTKEASQRQFREIQLLSMIERGFGWNQEFKGLRKLDEYLLRTFPFLRRFCRYVIIFSTK